jgi:soluble lytic murein transglycosylase-like protein
MIVQAADRYDVDPKVALAIAKCENRTLDPGKKNPHSSATGIYQFLTGSWKYYGVKHWGSVAGRDVMDPYDNIDLAMRVMASARGTKDWAASASCWRPKLV